MTDPRLDLTTEFPPPDRTQWREVVDSVLKGRDFESTLVSKTRDGLEIQPLYTADDLRSDAGAAHSPSEIPTDPGRVLFGWDIRQRHCGEVARCNREILEDVGGGVTSVELEVGSVADSSRYLEEVFEGVKLDLAPVVLAPHGDIGLAQALIDLMESQGIARSTPCWLGLDPLGGVARGDDLDALTGRVVQAAEFSTEASHRLPASRALTVDTTRYACAGATEAQQLAVSVATGVAYIRALESVGVAPVDAAGLIGFRFTATADQFVTIAKLRAARRLWMRVLEASGVPEESRFQSQQAVTSEAMYSRRDPWVNQLRATSAALAAGVAGADSITVLPFDLASAESGALGRRTARNTQTLLIEESNIARFVDPAAGSWFVESLTQRLAEMAWAGFQSIEIAGGMAAVLSDGSLATEISAAWEKRFEMLSTRQEPLTGVTEFPDLDDEPANRPDRATATGWPLRRLAAPFEELRDSSDRHLREHGSRPMVFAATLGDLATHTPRTTWLINLLAVAGIATEGELGDGADSPIEAAARFGESRCDVAVISSTSSVYADRGAATAVALRDAGASMVALTGAPGDLRDELESAGVDEFWYAGIDVLATLRQLMGRLTNIDPTNE